MAKVTVVSAVGTASATSLSGKTDLAKLIEAAMTQAVVECFADGVTDPDEMRDRKLAARERVKAEQR